MHAVQVTDQGGADVIEYDAFLDPEPEDRVALSARVSCGECELCRDGEESMCVRFHIIGEHVPVVHSELTTLDEDSDEIHRRYLRCSDARSSTAAPAARTVASSKCLPVSISPTGSSFADVTGTESDG